jgi:predicted transcriptional regulator
MVVMEVRLPPETEAKLSQIAAQQGRDIQSLVTEALERFLDYDDWFDRQVAKGLAQADRGELLEHEDVVRRIDQLLNKKLMATLDWSQCPAVESVPGKVSGAWVFKNTRLPVSVVFENLEAGATIEEISEWFDISVEEIRRVLEFAARPGLKK